MDLNSDTSICGSTINGSYTQNCFYAAAVARTKSICKIIRWTFGQLGSSCTRHCTGGRPMPAAAWRSWWPGSGRRGRSSCPPTGRALDPDPGGKNLRKQTEKCKEIDGNCNKKN